MKLKSVTLHHAAGTRSTRIRWLLEEVGKTRLKFRLNEISFRNSDHKQADFINLSKLKAVPLLDIEWDDGSVMRMVESGAMAVFIADAFPEAEFAPPALSTRARADYLQILHFGTTTMDSLLWQLRINEKLLPEKLRDSEIVRLTREKFTQRIEPFLLERLGNNKYICGQNFTAADCIIGFNILWARRHDLCRQNFFTRYLLDIAVRPEFNKAFDDAPNLRSEVNN